MRREFAKDTSMDCIIERIRQAGLDGVRAISHPLVKREVLELGFMGYLVNFEGQKPEIGGLSKEDLEIFKGDYDAKLCTIQW